MSLASSSLFYNIPLYFIVVRSTSAYTAGLHLLPNSVGLAVGSLLSGWIIRHTGMYRALGIASLVLPCITAGQLSTWDGETSELRTWLDLSWGGLGYSSFLVTSLIAMIAAVPRDEIGKATSISYLSRNLANTLSVLFLTCLGLSALMAPESMD
jgi:MFS family permease